MKLTPLTHKPTSNSATTSGPGSSLPLRCPACGSPQVVCRRPGETGRSAGAAVGAVAGAAAALADALRRPPAPAEAANSGSAHGVPGRLSQVVLGVISGAALGCQAGAATGQVLGNGMGRDHRCTACGHAFRG